MVGGKKTSPIISSFWTRSFQFSLFPHVLEKRSKMESIADISDELIQCLNEETETAKQSTKEVQEAIEEEKRKIAVLETQIEMMKEVIQWQKNVLDIIKEMKWKDCLIIVLISIVV